MFVPSPRVLDKDTSTWYDFKNNAKDLLDIKYPDAKLTINQTLEWLNNFENFIVDKYIKALEKVIPEEDRTPTIIHWTKTEAEDFHKCMSSNNYGWIWNNYEHSLYLAFRKYIGERTLKKVERTIGSVKIDPVTLEVELHVTPNFIYRQQADDFFKSQGASSVKFNVAPI